MDYYDESTNDDEYYGEEDEQIAKQELDHQQHANQTSGCTIYSFWMKFIIASILIGGAAAAGYFFGRYGNYNQSPGHVSGDQNTRIANSTAPEILSSNCGTEKLFKVSINEVNDSTLFLNPKKCVVYRIKTNNDGKVRIASFKNSL